ncbi:MAG: hypothetical protein LIO59_01150, partial [Oscillospiraceae bacterium]|nr:hypothetical protein [Oscillospiraceae bacterium]
MQLQRQRAHHIGGRRIYNFTNGGVAKATSDTIKITAADDVIITLAGVNIESGNASPFLIDSSAAGDVTVKLEGANTLTSTWNDYAGLQKASTDNELIITDGREDGSLTEMGRQLQRGNRRRQQRRG